MIQPFPTPQASHSGRGRPPQSTTQTQVIAVRIPEELRRRLDAYLARVQEEQPYLSLSRAAIIRTLLDKGLSTEGG